MLNEQPRPKADSGTPKSKLALLVVGHQYEDREQKGFYRALESRFDLTVHLVDKGWPKAINQFEDYDQFHAVMWYVRFRELRRQPPFDWGAFRGWRIMYDEDAYLNSRPMRSQGHKDIGAWPEVFRLQQFHRLICTGKATCAQLRSEGVDAVWIPKGFERNRVFDLGQARSGICYFGVKYDARLAMLRHLDKVGFKYSEFKCRYDDLNLYLNKYLGCLICNKRVYPDASGHGRIRNFFAHTRGLTRLLPLLKSRGLALGEGVEPMIKNFEVPGSGCVPFCDWMEELEDLGFEDGINAVTYNDFKELEEKLWHYSSREEELLKMGIAAHEMAHSRHTWDARATDLENMILSNPKH